MASDITDLFSAIVHRFDYFRGERDAYTLTDGRCFRTQAPEDTAFPCVIWSLVGGSVDYMFSWDSIETILLQCAVYDEFRNDASLGGAIMQSLIDIFEFGELFMPDGETCYVMKREGALREIVTDRVFLQLTQDWTVIKHTTSWRP